MSRAADDRGDPQAVHDAICEVLARIMRPLVSVPRWKFLREAVSGIVRQRTLVQRDIARALDETDKAPGTVERRLGVHINDPALAGTVNEGLLRDAIEHVQVYTPIAIDLTDTQRPHAHKTPGAEGNYDGSTGTPGWGYTHICAAAVMPSGSGVEFLPLYQETYGMEHATGAHKDDPLLVDSSFSHYERVVRTLKDVFGGPVGIDVMDRGMDSQRCFGCEIYHRRWFLVRLCDCRRKLRIAGIPTAMYPADAPSHLDGWHKVSCRVFNKKTRLWKMKKCRIAWCTVIVPVQYPNGAVEDRPLTLVVVRRGSHTMFLLTNLTIDDAEDPVAFAKMLYEAYLARWSVETCFDLMKNRINVERIFARTMEAAQGLFALAWLAVACIMEAFPPGAKITRTVIAFLARFHRVHPGRHVFYTVFTSLTRIWACMPVVCSLH